MEKNENNLEDNLLESIPGFVEIVSVKSLNSLLPNGSVSIDTDALYTVAGLSELIVMVSTSDVRL